MLIKTKQFKQNDNNMYIMEVVSDKIIVNDNYNGILILDDNLNLIKKLKLFEGITVYKTYVNKINMEMLLFCTDNECLVYIDLSKYSYNIIHLKDGFEDLIFSDICQWNSEGLILSTYDNEFFKVCTSEETIKKIHYSEVSRECSELYGFYQGYLEEGQFEALELLQDNYIAIVKNEKVYINNMDTTEHVFDIEVTDIIGIEFIKGMASLVSEDLIEVVKSGCKEKIIASKGHMLTRARFITKLDEIYIVILSSRKSDFRCSKIRMFQVSIP